MPIYGGKLHSKSYPSRKPNSLEDVRIKDYECSVCHERVNASFDDFIESSSNYTRDVKHGSVKLSELVKNLMKRNQNYLKQYLI